MVQHFKEPNQYTYYVVIIVIMAIKDVTPLEITTAKLVLTMPATLIPESKSNFSKRVNGLEVTFFL